MVRRVVAGRVSLAVEFDLRERFYAHLQRLELGFFDGQQTGQLMSRATVDLQSIRFFLGYGLIFITQNLLTIALASAVMFAIEPWLALIALAPAPARRLHRLPLQPRLAPRRAGGAAAARRADRGGRGERLRASASSRPSPARSTSFAASAARSPASSTRASTRPGCRRSSRRCSGCCPSSGIALVLLIGGRQVIANRPQPRRLHRLLHLPGDAGGADADARHGDGDGAAGDRLRQPPVRDPRPRAADREPARRAAAARRRRPGRAARRDAALRQPMRRAHDHPGVSGCALRASTSRSRPGAPWLWSAPPDRARRAWWR